MGRVVFFCLKMYFNSQEGVIPLITHFVLKDIFIRLSDVNLF